ncbi:MAG: 1-(5-phosphoribosyl)-5-[(5-phosphoribosylamino)methylideneamino]imidazole-4-carboxamide isomerase [Prevotella sp.]|nr:1-(5-phosphoribosyl)-5-[(5-phosphoribosylamino)methylideneamino]imidazole-4-carboxamide isomerase [Prevotella sp.]
MEIIPAIDIIGGQVVRLRQGDYRQKTVYASSPAAVARRFEQLGFRRLHVVDLDGAKSKHVVNIEALRGITSATRLTVDFGGGIKTDDDIEQAFAAGAHMVTVGSVAVSHPELMQRWVRRYGADRLILGADVRHGHISVNGWQEDSAQELAPFLRRYVDMGISQVLCTDISRDGMMQGPAVELYEEILQAFPGLQLIASGGVATRDDLLRLEAAGLPAVVTGKAMYEGTLGFIIDPDSACDKGATESKKLV